MMNNDPEQTQTIPQPPVIAGPPGPLNPLTMPEWNADTSTVPVWAGLAAQHGWSRTGRHEDRGDGRPWTSLVPWEPEKPERSPWVLRAVLIALAVLVAVLAGVAVQRWNLLPASVPLIGKDSGVAACEAIAKGEKPVEASGIMNMVDYRAALNVFSDSRYPAIRDNGVRLMNLAWQAQGMGSNNLGVLVLMNSMADAYAGLAGGCAAVGYRIPALGQV